MLTVASALMPSRLRSAGLAAGLVVTAALFEGGCGDNTSTACVPGQSIACVGDQACDSSFQVCKDDGSGYGECLCSRGGVTFTRTGAGSGLIGAACESDAYCRKGLTCLATSSTDINGEGPSGGFCVAPCPAAGGNSFCAGVDANAKCVTLDNKGTPSTDDDVVYCMPGCTIGSSKDPDKCRSRPDSVCTEDKLGSGVGYCRPACRNDTDCAPRHCDIGTGLCGDTAPSGDPIGAACDANSSCTGACFPEAGGYAECSGVCSYGEPGGCGQARTTPPYDFFCYIDGALRAGAGDLGYCARVCDCDGDCGRPDAVCEPSSDVSKKTGRAGVCGSKVFGNGTARQNIPCRP